MTDKIPPIAGLGDRVAWHRKLMTAEDEGGFATTYMPLMQLWARVTAVGPRATTLADGRAVTMTHTAVIRHRDGVRPGDRFIYRDRPLEILSAEDISGQRRFLACQCVERTVTG